MSKSLVLLTLTVVSTCASCVSSPAAPVSTRHDVFALLEAAEAAHRCAHQEAADKRHAAELTACVRDNRSTARALLPGVMAAGSMQPGPLAVVRLFIDENASAEHAALCAQVPATDILDGLLDDEAREQCGK